MNNELQYRTPDQYSLSLDVKGVEWFCTPVPLQSHIKRFHEDFKIMVG
jgi:hypothetical protein